MTNIQTALKSGAVLVAQFSTSTGFTLHCSRPAEPGIPFVDAMHLDLQEAFAMLETEVRDHLILEEESCE